MSNLKESDFRILDELVNFLRGKGYVLGFSDRTFSQFFANELDVDIDDLIYAENGGSKGRRLRRFLELADNPTAARTLGAIWDIRSDIIGDDKDPVAGAKRKYESILAKVSNGQSSSFPDVRKVFDHEKIASLRDQLTEMADLNPQQRGYAFERFLMSLFDLFDMKPREPFRNAGEQIDGSFSFHNETYLIEAKWQTEPTSAKDLRDFEGKLSEKAHWVRGLFISKSGFSESALDVFRGGKRTICMTGQDLYDMLDRAIPLNEVIARKARRAAEDGHPLTPVTHLF